jgi:hypothetical protein
MKKFSVASLFLILSVLLLVTGSCDSGSCIDETESLLKANLYVTGGNLKAPDSLTVYGINTTEKIYSKTAGVTTALIPLNSAENKSVFVFRINGIYDTVTFRYSSYPHLISKECGYTYYHDFGKEYTEYTKHIIDSIELRNGSITTLNVENIRIFY